MQHLKTQQKQSQISGKNILLKLLSKLKSDITHNKALVRTQTTLRFVCAAQLGR